MLSTRLRAPMRACSKEGLNAAQELTRQTIMVRDMAGVGISEVYREAVMSAGEDTHRAPAHDTGLLGFTGPSPDPDPSPSLKLAQGASQAAPAHDLTCTSMYCNYRNILVAPRGMCGVHVCFRARPHNIEILGAFWSLSCGELSPLYRALTCAADRSSRVRSVAN